MCQKIIYGIHTGDYKHQISAKEARYIKTVLCNGANGIISENELLKKNGITFSVIEQPKTYSMNKDSGSPELTFNGMEYFLLMRINHSCVIGENGNLVMELSQKNVKKMVKEVNHILKNVFKLEDQNADFKSWSAERIDDAFDLYLYDDPRLLIYLLNASLQLPPLKRCSYYKEYEMTPDCDRAFESVYFFNKSYAINAYAKWYELKKKQPNISESDPTHNLLRVERQSEQQYLKEFLPNRTVSDLLKEGNLKKMRSSLKECIKTFWGTGDFYDEVIHYKYSMIAKIELSKPLYSDHCKAYKDLMEGGRLYTHQNMHKEALEWFDSHKMAPACIAPSARNILHIYKSPSRITGLYNMIDQRFPDSVMKKPYHSFAVPIYSESRGDWKVSMTVHINRLNKGEPDSACGKTYDDCQKAMFEKLKDHYETNKKCGWFNDGLRMDFRNFYRTVRSRELKKEIKEYLERNGESL